MCYVEPCMLNPTVQLDSTSEWNRVSYDPKKMRAILTVVFSKTMPSPGNQQETKQRQPWSETERQAIRAYAADNRGCTWRTVRRWFLSQPQNMDKKITQSQISRILNPKRPRGPSDVDPVQIQKLLPTSKRLRTGK